MRVIGTAGHVDHGKSTLIAALTGTHPDRLKEEQEREMTIDLGFAWLTLPDGEEIGIVDVPGHRDFIENMLAGVGGIDAALLVIAADEGVMPQTREHLAILNLLQIETGLVVMTKIDLVNDPEWIALTEADIRSTLKGTALEKAPIVRVSSLTREGFPELLDEMSLMLKEKQARLDIGRPRLPIDRVFSITGFGTIVTGTLTDGSFRNGDEVEILPSGLHARIRGLQTHKKKEERAIPGSRTAINLAGVEVDELQRGQVVTRPGQYQPTQRLDVHFRLLADATAPLRHHREVKLFTGTAETIADVRLLGVELLQPGESGWLQLELHQPVAVARGDHYILRLPSPGETLGGGVIIDPAPGERHKRFDGAVLKELESLMKGSPAEMLVQASLALGPATIKEMITRSHLDTQEAEKALSEAITNGQLIVLDGPTLKADGNGVVMAVSQWSTLQETIHETVGKYHQAYPLRRGMPKEELKSRLKLSPRVFNSIIHFLAVQKILKEGDKWAALPGHEVRFSPFEQVKVDKLLKRFASTPYAPPSIKDCKADVGEDVFNTLLNSGDLTVVSEEVVFRRDDYTDLVGKIRRMLEVKSQITLAEVRDQLGTSRRYIQALLEHLDGIGMTVREGDLRRLKK